MSYDDFGRALTEIDTEPRKTGRRLIARHYNEIMELVGMGLTRAEIYRRVSERIDLGMSEGTFSTYMSEEAKRRGE